MNDKTKHWIDASVSSIFDSLSYQTMNTILMFVFFVMVVLTMFIGVCFGILPGMSSTVLSVVVFVGGSLFISMAHGNLLSNVEKNYESQLGGTFVSNTEKLRIDRSGSGPEFVWSTPTGTYKCKAYLSPTKEDTYATLCDDGKSTQEAYDIINKASAK